MTKKQKLALKELFQSEHTKELGLKVLVDKLQCKGEFCSFDWYGGQNKNIILKSFIPSDFVGFCMFVEIRKVIPKDEEFYPVNVKGILLSFTKYSTFKKAKYFIKALGYTFISTNVNRSKSYYPGEKITSLNEFADLVLHEKDTAFYNTYNDRVCTLFREWENRPLRIIHPLIVGGFCRKAIKIEHDD